MSHFFTVLNLHLSLDWLSYRYKNCFVDKIQELVSHLDYDPYPLYNLYEQKNGERIKKDRKRLGQEQYNFRKRGSNKTRVSFNEKRSTVTNIHVHGYYWLHSFSWDRFSPTLKLPTPFLRSFCITLYFTVCTQELFILSILVYLKVYPRPSFIKKSHQEFSVRWPVENYWLWTNSD